MGLRCNKGRAAVRLGGNNGQRQWTKDDRLYIAEPPERERQGAAGREGWREGVGEEGSRNTNESKGLIGQTMRQVYRLTAVDGHSRRSLDGLPNSFLETCIGNPTRPGLSAS